MGQDLVYLVEGSSATPAVRVSLAEAGLTEREDLQEWVVAHPEVIADGVRVITIEYDRWSTGSGTSARQRLDVLGLDRAGRLVVVELKRERDRDIHLQALTYAALVSRFTIATLASVHADFLSRRGQPTSPDEAMAHLRDHVEGDFDAELLVNPRIVLLAADHPPQVVTAVDWLCTVSGHRLSIELRTMSAWRVGDQIAVQFDSMYPVVGIDDMLLSPTEANATTTTVAEKTTEATRAANTVQRIIENGLLAIGAPLTLQPTTEIPADTRAAIEAWVAEEPSRGRAAWTADSAGPLRWEGDGNTWRPTTLIRHIIKQASGLDRGGRGPAWWITEAGTDLTALAYGRNTRDWTDLHQLIEQLHPGEWTNYGELAQIIAVPAISVGQHIATCPECPYGAHRVLTSTGKPAEGFRWTDPTIAETCQEVLTDEGVTFDPDGRANPNQKISVATLQQRRKLGSIPSQNAPTM
jgi:alkylated DNA nucleotide flippase Atl1